jgi:galactoside O-acetyltransferase
LQAGCILNAFDHNIILGADCLIGARCTLTPYQHSVADRRLPIREQPLVSRGDILIEDDVWLGANVSVMDGVTVGRGSIVGAGAVVTRSIPPYSIAAGIPARVIRPRFDGA